MDCSPYVLPPLPVTENCQRNNLMWFPELRLPTLTQLGQYSRFYRYNNKLQVPNCSVSQASGRTPQLRPQGARGAPVKPKNSLVSQHSLTNTRGTPFKFSFIPQILVAHLQHLFFLKGKTRYNRSKWLRLYRREGEELAKRIKELVGGDLEILHFKRAVSSRELRTWLLAETYCDPGKFDPALVSQVRIEAFRKLCILKCLDLEENYMLDFNVEASGTAACEIFRVYLTQTLWDELSLPTISDKEVCSTLASSNYRSL